jgi:predicted RNase H-like HicB family nuclease
MLDAPRSARVNSALGGFADTSCVKIALRWEMTFTVEYEQENDGRWLAEVLELSGVLAYGQTSDEAIAKAQALALRVLADRLEHGESAPEFLNISFAAA